MTSMKIGVNIDFLPYYSDPFLFSTAKNYEAGAWVESKLNDKSSATLYCRGTDDGYITEIAWFTIGC